MFPHYALPAGLDSSTGVLLGFAVVGILGVVLLRLGWLGKIFGWIDRTLQRQVRIGFHCWAQLLSWASWPTFLVMVLLLVGLALWKQPEAPYLGYPLGGILMLFGVVATLAYVHLDLERLEVARGYKVLHDPRPGQQLAAHLARYGSVIDVPLLLAATISLICGFSIFNLAISGTIGEKWYLLGKHNHSTDFWDFLAYTLLNLFRLADLLHIANSYGVQIKYLTPNYWPASTLLLAFRSFFTLVLVQQISASLRQGRLLSETIADYWNPHPPIHERAVADLPQYGPSMIRAMLRSIRAKETLNAEQRRELPSILAAIGLAAVKPLARGLTDKHATVRGLCCAALAQLPAWSLAGKVAKLANDADPYVRQCVAEALGAMIGRDRTPAPQTIGYLTEHIPWDRQLRRAWHHWRHRTQPTTWLPELQILIDYVSDPNERVRKAALRALAAIGPFAAPATAAVASTLRDPDEDVRCLGAIALGRLGGPIGPSVTSLCQLLANPSPATQIAGLDALRELGPAARDAIPCVLDALQSSDDRVIEAARSALAKLGTIDGEDLDALAHRLQQPDSQSRAEAARLIGLLGESAGPAAADLALALSDENDAVRAQVAESLGRIGAAAAVAVPQLKKALHDRDDTVSALAAEALGEIGAPARSALPELILALEHRNARVRAQSARALGSLQAEARPAISALLAALNDAEEEVRWRALEALAQIGELPEETWILAIASADDPHPSVRAAALALLVAQLPVERRSPKLLLAALCDSSPDVRACAIRGAGEWGLHSEPLETAAIACLSDDAVEIQIAAARALRNLPEAAIAAGPDLRQLALAGEADARVEALRTLAVLQPPEAVETFLEALEDTNTDVRMLASAGLIEAKQLPETAIPQVIAALSDPVAQVRANAAKALSNCDPFPEEALPALAECADDPNDAVRMNVGLALQKAPASACNSFFEQLLYDENPRLQLLAAGSLLEHHAQHARADEVVQLALVDSNPQYRRLAFQRISTLGGISSDHIALVRERASVEADAALREQMADWLAKLSPA